MRFVYLFIARLCAEKNVIDNFSSEMSMKLRNNSEWRLNLRLLVLMVSLFYYFSLTVLYYSISHYKRLSHLLTK